MSNIPNLLTMLRILLMPLLVIYFSYNLSDSNYIATSIIIVASLSDVLDGWIARKFNQKSIIGSIFDPIADKLMITVVMLLLNYRYNSFVLMVVTILLLSREFIVSGLRESLAVIFKDALLPVSIFGKIKTTLQMISIIALVLYDQSMSSALLQLGFIGLILATVMSYCSLFQYSLITYKQLNSNV